MSTTTTARTYTTRTEADRAAQVLREASYTAEVRKDKPSGLYVLTTNAPDDACPQCVVCHHSTGIDSLGGLCSLCDWRGFTKADAERASD